MTNTMMKEIHRNALPLHTKNGWVVAPRAECARSTHVTVQSLVHGLHQTKHYIERKRINLLQLGNIKRPLGEHRGRRLSEAVSLEYMGASEFEFGATARSLRRMESHMFCYKQTVVDSIQDARGKFRLYSYFEQEDLDEYVAEIKLLISSRGARTHEPHYLDDPKTKYDFWWDIENDVIFSYDKNFMNGLAAVLRASFNHMNAGRAAATD